MIKNHLLALLLAAAWTPVAHAEGSGQPAGQPPAAQEHDRGERRGACRQDVEKLCKDKKGAVMACMSSNLSQIQNPECKSQVEKFKAKDDGIKAACASDISADKCTGMDIGTGLLKCLGANRKSLSDGCKAELKKDRPERKGRGGWGRRGDKGAQRRDGDSGEGLGD